MSGQIADSQWAQYEEQGYLRLGRVASIEELTALQGEIDHVMLGKAQLDYDRLMMQLDSTSGKYEDAGVQSPGFKGSTLAYRKIENLEFDEVFLRYMQLPIFRDICERVYGKGNPIACFRAMFMNKPARQGTLLPWHQDRWSSLDLDPQITLWTALDPATVANGCVEIIPGTHHRLQNRDHPSGFLTPEQAEECTRSGQSVHIELDEGEVVLLHNWLLHRSDVNHTDHPRRAFSVCYMDGATRSSSGQQFNRIFGEGSLDPQNLCPVKA